MATNYGIPSDWARNTNEGRTHIATKGVAQNGLVYNIDAGVATSYPGTGTTFFDLKENHNLILTNGPTYSTEFGGAIIFDGTDDYASVTNISNSSPISVTTEFTIEQIFKPTGYQPSSYFGLKNMLLNKGPASTYNYATQLGSDTEFQFIKRTDPENLQFHTFTVPSMLDKVNVVTLVIQNGNDSGIDTVSCYYNGTFISTLSITGAAIAAGTSDPLGLGVGTQYTNFIGVYYVGRIYNRALSAQEVLRNFQIVQKRFGL